MINFSPFDIFALVILLVMFGIVLFYSPRSKKR